MDGLCDGTVLDNGDVVIVVVDEAVCFVGARVSAGASVCLEGRQTSLADDGVVLCWLVHQFSHFVFSHFVFIDAAVDMGEPYVITTLLSVSQHSCGIDQLTTAVLQFDLPDEQY